MSKPQPEVEPFLKWVGGKRWLVSHYEDLIPDSYETYIEPFLGAGSVFFHLRPCKALLGDTNAELIATYEAIKDEWKAVHASLKYRQRCHLKDPDAYYYKVRQRIPSKRGELASRLIYLNRTCFNGIYRVNREGRFNVPRGTRDTVVFDTDNFEHMSRVLRDAELIAGDFEALVDRATNGDFVFCDPPYTVRHNYNGFRKYNEVLFSWEDQERLADSLRRAARRGVKVLCTNANHPSVRDLYCSDYFRLRGISRPSNISADITSRGHFEELVIQANV